MKPGMHPKMRIVTNLSLGIAVALLAAACGSSPKADSGSPAVTRPASATGCGTAASGSATLTLRVSERARTVIVHVPSGYTGTSHIPLVLNMHGSGSTAAAQELFSGMDSAADTDNF